MLPGLDIHPARSCRFSGLAGVRVEDADDVSRQRMPPVPILHPGEFPMIRSISSSRTDLGTVAKVKGPGYGGIRHGHFKIPPPDHYHILFLEPGEPDRVGDTEELPPVLLPDQFRVGRVPSAQLGDYSLRDEQPDMLGSDGDIESFVGLFMSEMNESRSPPACRVSSICCAIDAAIWISKVLGIRPSARTWTIPS